MQLTEKDILLLNLLQREANEHHDGHLTILKFTTNWRVGFFTPDGREDIDDLWVGKTFEAAAKAALSSKYLKQYEGAPNGL